MPATDLSLGQEFDNRARAIRKGTAFFGKTIEEKLDAVAKSGDALAALDEEFGRALADAYAPDLTPDQQEAIYEYVWSNDKGIGFVDIEEAYASAVDFLSTYPIFAPKD